MLKKPKENKYSPENVESMFMNCFDFPIPDFVFPDITYLLENENELFRLIIDKLVMMHSDCPPEYIVCIESFGYIFGAPMAYQMNSKLVLARKKGKLPREKYCEEYPMIYCNNKAIELHKEAIGPKKKTLVVDDFLASGGTSYAVMKMLDKMKADVIGLDFVVEVPSAKGRERLSEFNAPVNSIIELDYFENIQKWKCLGIYL